MLQRLHGGVTRARIMPLNPDPSDLGATYVWDDGAEQPRPRRDDDGAAWTDRMHDADSGRMA